MNMRNLCTIFLMGLLILGAACKKSSDGYEPLGGSQSAIGEVGNSFSIGSISGVNNVSANVTELSNGVSTIAYSATVTNPSYLEMIKSMDDVTVSGNSIQREREYRITTEGIESVYPEGNLTLVKYDTKVGDVYSLDRGSKTIRREVTSVSHDDDYYWGGMYIKTIHVKETGRGIPGVSNIEFVFNHKFGIVGLKISFEDGTSKEIGIFSNSNN